MTRRHAPEDHDATEYPLFAGMTRTVSREDLIREAQKIPPEAVAYLEQAEARAVAGMTRAADKADRVESGWRANAVEAVRLYARTHTTFLAEDVLREFPPPDEADARCMGAVMRLAAKFGYVVADGFAPAASSNRSPKTRWRSLIR